MSSVDWMIHGQLGFTLLEVLIAICVLTIGLLGVASMQVSAMRGNFFSDHVTTALCLAEDKMEDLMGRDFVDDDLVDKTPGNNGSLDSITNVDFEEKVNVAGQVTAGGPYHRIWNIADSTNPEMKTVTVIVSWDRDRHRVTLTSCINPQ